MLFNSMTFAVFLLAAFILYHIVPAKYRWIFLLAASYVFYMNLHAAYGLLLFFTTLLTYALALGLEKAENRRAKRRCLLGGVWPLVGILLIFKLGAPVIERLNALIDAGRLSMQPLTVKILLPAGVSFYFFQSMGYLIDVYRGKCKAERHFGYYALFVSFFPQLLAGPIGRADSLLPQLKKERCFDYRNVTYGLKLMAWGYFKKLVIADVFATVVNKVYDNPYSYVGLVFIITTVMFAIEIYCDFSGYSDIAIGCARLFGIELMTNFKTPYFAFSIREFWSRWHISLSLWLRDYVYIPLGGNRVSGLRHKFNILVTFLVCGLWHGASWNYVLWGGINGAGVIGQKAGSRLHGALYPFLQIALTFIFIATVRVFSRLSTIDHVFKGFRKIIFDFGAPFFNFVLLTGLSAMVLVVIKDLKDEYFPTIKIMNSDNFWISNISTGLLLALIVLLGSLNSNSFIYFQF